MELENVCVEFVTNKIYFLEDNMSISFKFKDKCKKIKYSDWIALYKCSNNRNLEEFVAVETDLIIRKPAKNGFHCVMFYKNQLKSVKCNEEYEFIYGNECNQIYGKSCSLRFIHKNDCDNCNPSISEMNIMEMNHCNNCASQEMVNSILTRMSIVDSKLRECKIESSEIMSHNERLMAQIDECVATMQNTNNFLDNLFYTDEPVTIDGYRYMQPCSDIDLKMNLIENQERILQDLSNQNTCLDKVLEKVEYKNNKTGRCVETQTDESYLLIHLFQENDEDNPNANMEQDKLLDSAVNVETGFIPEPSTATVVFIVSDEDDC